MKPILRTLAALAGSLAGLACNGPDVVQGTVLSYDQTARTLVVQDEVEPHSETVFSAANADVGAVPRTGDVVRVAYRADKGALRATRIMNVTRQQESKKAQAE